MIEPYSDSIEHLLHELARVDMLVRQAVQRFRAAQPQPPDEYQGLFVSDAEVDAHLNGTSASTPQFRPAIHAGQRLPHLGDALHSVARNIAARLAASGSVGNRLRLPELTQRFGLSEFDADVLLLVLAPELDLKYERLYAYLQDDVTRKRPSVDLVLNLLCSSVEAKLAARARFTPSAPLFAQRLMSLFHDPAQLQPPLLAQSLKLDERVVNHLLNLDDLDTRLMSYAHVIRPRTRLDEVVAHADVKRRLAQLARRERQQGTVFYLQGARGVGKQAVAEAMCGEFGLHLIHLDGERLLNAESISFEALLHLATREAHLRGAALYFSGFDSLLGDDQRARREALLLEAAASRRPFFLAGATAWEPSDALRDVAFTRIELPQPDYAERVELWTQALGRGATRVGDMDAENAVDIGALANHFRLTRGQIYDAAATAHRLAGWRDQGAGRLTQADLYAACRLQSGRGLSTLARKINPHYRWQDIVLPANRMEQLREVAAMARHRALVLETWGFDGKLALGKGLNVLFTGPSGTGKTMAADILAGELGLELYKIDLSSVVSKYIGETEKHLSRIFAEARVSNAILFFDEADALFGKRSEVRDAHDRYANIEIAYLLQQMEEYDGVVILATNLRKNMDDAFVRRMHFTIEFPFPNESDRRRIWGSIWPDAAPRRADLDLDLMARRFEIAGGNIRNVALAAAFLAAAEGRPIAMAHLMRATQREYQKMGKVVLDGEFSVQSREAQ